MKYDVTHLENAAIERTCGHLDNRFYQFMEGAESDAAKEYWQQEMYTEEEVLSLMIKSHFSEMNIYEFFEKNKKKTS